MSLPILLRDNLKPPLPWKSIAIGAGLLGVTVSPLLGRDVKPAESIEVPARFKAATGGKEVTRGSAHQTGPWWQLFHDPVLDKLMREAVAGNRDLYQSVARVVEAREQARTIAAGFYPTLTAPLHATRQRTTNTGPIVRSRIIGSGIFPAGNGVSGPESFAGQALTNSSNDFSTELSLGYEVDLFGRIRHAYAQGRATTQAFEADRRAVELSLTSQVAASYFTLRALDSQMALLRRTLRLRADAIQIQEARLKAGVAGDIDVFRARFELANAEAELADVTQRRTESENAMAVLCGQPASGLHLAEHPLDHGLPPAVPITIPAQLLTQRPDLVEEERRVAAEGEGIKSVKAEFFPTVKVGANYGFESADSAELFKDQSHVWSITGGISIPIFEGGRNAARLNAARARKQQALAAYQQAALNAFKEAENALSGLRQRALQAEARGRAAENARHVFDIAQKSYREGAINYFEVIDAQRILLNAELAEVQTLNTRYSATIDLIRAVGGGYER